MRRSGRGPSARPTRDGIRGHAKHFSKVLARHASLPARAPKILGERIVRKSLRHRHLPPGLKKSTQSPIFLLPLSTKTSIRRRPKEISKGEAQ
jgi:hypothetical protein